jgi:P-type E1-E2 ATPase
MRRVSEKEYTRFNRIHTQLTESIASINKEEELSQLYSKMENKLRYLGCSAVEDRLQEGVPEAIANLMWAEIRFWVLTGDKLETAVEIARSCKIIENDTLTVTLRP